MKKEFFQMESLSYYHPLDFGDGQTPFQVKDSDYVIYLLSRPFRFLFVKKILCGPPINDWSYSYIDPLEFGTILALLSSSEKSFFLFRLDKIIFVDDN